MLRVSTLKGWRPKAWAKTGLRMVSAPEYGGGSPAASSALGDPGPATASAEASLAAAAGPGLPGCEPPATE